MFKFNNIYYSRLLVIAFLLIGIANFLSDWTIYNLLSLNPALILSHLEFWRMLSFAFVPGSIEGTLLFVYAFWFVGPKLEERFHVNKLGLMITLVSFIMGSIFSIIFLNQNIYLTGNEGLSLFVVTLFVMTELSADKSKFNLSNPISMPMILLVTVIWFASTVINNSFNHAANGMTTVISASIGILLSTLVFMQIKFALYVFGQKRTISPAIKISQPEELIRSSSTKREATAHNTYEDEIEEYVEEPDSEYYSEEKLNRILDKMNEFGRDSLNSSEKLYLKEYSNYL